MSFALVLKTGAKYRWGRDFASVEHAYINISLTRDRGKLNPGVKLTPGWNYTCKVTLKLNSSAMCLEPIPTSKMKLFCKNSQRLKAVNYFHKKLHLRCYTGFWIHLCSSELFISPLRHLHLCKECNHILIQDFALIYCYTNEHQMIDIVKYHVQMNLWFYSYERRH